MMRPNLAQDKPPTELTVGGKTFSINVDYRVWIDALKELRNFILKPTTPEHMAHNVMTIVNVEKLIFGKLIDAEPADLLHAVTEFAKGYPEPPVGGSDGLDVQTYSFECDINYIVLAIKTQYGIDICYERKEPFHWWLFLLYFRNLTGHYINRLMEIRGYTGKDADLRKQARRFAVPDEKTANDEASEAELKDIFYNC